MQGRELGNRKRSIQLGCPPPDLWINAKGIAQAKQPAGFSHFARGPANQQGGWTKTPCSPGAITKPAFAAKGEMLLIE